MESSDRISPLHGLLALALFLAAYQFTLGHLIPTQQGLLGHDYHYYIPQLLQGRYWFEQNGLFSIPWFTPATCGGNLIFAHPQDIYFSVPQFLTFFIDPVTAIQLSFYLFASIGFVGFFYLLNKRFGLGVPASLLGAFLFGFNEFYAYRMVVGHLIFHSYMFLPWVALLLLPSSATDTSQTFSKRLPALIGAALLMTYTIHSGIGQVLLPMGLSLLIIILLHSLNFGQLKLALSSLLLTALFTLALSAAKLAAIQATLTHLSRSSYPLPGIPDPIQSVWQPMKELFFTGMNEGEMAKLITNEAWRISQHELEYGITFIPFLLIVIGLVKLPRKHFRSPIFIMLVLLLTLPIALNFYQADWNQWLKTIPLIESSSSLFRWYIIFIPISIIFAVIVVEKLPLRSTHRLLLIAFLILVMIGVHNVKDQTTYLNDPQAYNPIQLSTLEERFNQTKDTPQIQHIVGAIPESKLFTNAYFLLGASSFQCYEPLFGYRLESMPKRSQFRTGPVDKNFPWGLNMKNPSCYVFPESNHCQPGDHFQPRQQAEMHKFAQFKAFSFEFSELQKISNLISLFAFLLALSFLAFKQINRRRKTQ